MTAAALEKDDLRAAVAAGILSERQAASLSALALSRAGARENLAAGDEPFELFKGFNEIFIVVGLLILSAGWIGVNAVAFLGRISNPQQAAAFFGITSAIGLWLLSEYFIRRRRMVAPAIALSILFAVNAGVSLVGYYAQIFMVAREDFSSLPFPMILATGALFVFWLRFRVPFALAMIALGCFAVALTIAATRAGSPGDVSDLFLLSAGGPFAWITLALGLAVFGVAMAFDMSDPHRVTRRSAQGFWLHLVAAPALVNTLALSLLDGGSEWVLLFVLLGFALVAIIIDRRSFLIAAIGYIVVLTTTVFDGESAWTTVLALGLVLLLLGAFWENIRARVLRSLPFLPLKRLPPSV